MGPELEFVWKDVVMRVDGDVLETFSSGSHGRRTLLRWLVVRAELQKKGRVQIIVGSKRFKQVMEGVEVPLYAWGKLDDAYQGNTFMVEPDEEPAFREFFTHAAQACGRSVGPLGPS